MGVFDFLNGGDAPRQPGVGGAPTGQPGPSMPRPASGPGGGFRPWPSIASPGAPVDPIAAANERDAIRARLVQDPVTGYFYDPKTGTSYTDRGLSTPITNPNTAQQIAANWTARQAFLAKLSGSEGQVNDAIGGMDKLGASLSRTINDPTASSVAQMQLQQGLGQISNEQLSGAAGASGNNAFLARRNALNNIASAGARANQTAGLVRADEVSAAQGRLAQVLNSKAGAAQNMYTTNTGAARGFADLAAGSDKTRSELDTQTDLDNRKREAGLVNQVIGGVATAGQVARGGK